MNVWPPYNNSNSVSNGCILLLATHNLFIIRLGEINNVVYFRQDVDIYLNNMEQEFRVEMSKMFMKEYNKRSADAGEFSFAGTNECKGVGTASRYQDV